VGNLVPRSDWKKKRGRSHKAQTLTIFTNNQFKNTTRGLNGLDNSGNGGEGVPNNNAELAASNSIFEDISPLRFVSAAKKFWLVTFEASQNSIAKWEYFENPPCIGNGSVIVAVPMRPVGAYISRWRLEPCN
jgi:hypothetical protein